MIVSQEIAPHTVTPCENCCMPIDNKCRIGPLAGALNTCAVVIITETESGFITEGDTSPVCHTPNLPEVGKNPVDTAYDVGSVQLPYRSDRGGGRYVYSTSAFSEAYYAAPISPSAARTAAGSS
ncbi:hypothetical protein TNCV_379991 [Trichonephila clavipes]|nr:hypothetical protein TNCV_379991 [Trichonephila clavipes]